MLSETQECLWPSVLGADEEVWKSSEISLQTLFLEQQSKVVTAAGSES